VKEVDALVCAFCHYKRFEMVNGSRVPLKRLYYWPLVQSLLVPELLGALASAPSSSCTFALAPSRQCQTPLPCAWRSWRARKSRRMVLSDISRCNSVVFQPRTASWTATI